MTSGPFIPESWTVPFIMDAYNISEEDAEKFVANYVRTLPITRGRFLLDAAQRVKNIVKDEEIARNRAGLGGYEVHVQYPGAEAVIAHWRNDREDQ
jgi:hypothetical protein